MALVTISGYPCSGKTRRAEQLRAYFEQRIQEQQSPDGSGDGCESPKLKVVVISDDTLSTKRRVYDDGRQEKPARASLFSTMQRHIGKDVIVIVDGMNYIKGYRYQMYCAAREYRVRTCTLHVVAKPEQCKEWNALRAEMGEDSYNPATLDNLIMRYEEPSSMVRWDSPLFTVTWMDEDVPGEDMWKAITEGYIKPPNAGTSAAAVAPTETLHLLENTCATIVSAIFSEQSASQDMGFSGGQTTLSLPTTGRKFTYHSPARSVTLSELQRLKRQFVRIHQKAVTLGTTEKGAVDWSEERIVEKFELYLKENL